MVSPLRSLTVKIALACMLVSLAGIGLVALLAVQTASREFGSFVFNEHGSPLIQYLQTYYQENGTWEGVQLNRPSELAPMPEASRLGRELVPTPEVSRFGSGGLTLVDPAGRVVVPGEGFTQGQQLSEAQLATGAPIVLNDQTVGILVAVPNAPGYGGPAGAAFLGRTNQALIWGAAGAAALALVIGALLARALTRPLKQLTEAAHAIAEGQLQQRVETRSQDEIGELAGAFNRMSADLARASQLRRQMTADIAHDLRTPLSLILAHAEALRDGVLPPAPETFTLIHDEATHLSRLVDDLRTLSLADAGELALNRRPSPPAELLERAVAKQMIRAQTHDVGLHAEAAPGLPLVNVDPDRMAQVLGNLLDNALRHTPGGGRVECRVTQTEAVRAVTFSVSDSGPGIAPEDLPHVFERLYRSDKSRRRDAPGSGLGLAIARSIIEAHGGRIWAESPPGQGAHFFVQVPGAAA